MLNGTASSRYSSISKAIVGTSSAQSQTPGTSAPRDCLARFTLLLTITFIGGFVAGGAAQRPVRSSVGVVNFPISCSAAAQVEFNRGVTLLHHMTYPAARESFRKVAQREPQCAMAQWGIAMTLFQPLWPTRPGLADRRQGWDAVQTALRITTTSARERMLINAVGEFFREPDSTDYWQRIRRWEKAMAGVYADFPHDPDVTAFYALAHIAAAPANEDSVAAHGARAAALLLKVYHQHPGHPGAMHYLVHVNDAPGRERSSLDVTEKYEASAPRNPHALHMPTHIYTRLGNWNAVIRGNLLAAQAALRQPAGDRGQYVWDEFPHAIEYLVYAYLQQGADVEAAAQVKRLLETPRLEPTFKTAFHLASTQARYLLERHAWKEAASLVPREAAGLDWDKFSWPEAVTWFAKGLGAAREHRLDEARVAIDRIAVLGKNAESVGEALFGRNIRVLELEVRAWVAYAEGDIASSLRLARDAAELETATPKPAVTPAPTIPAHELWGDLLFEQRQPAEALAMYRTSLKLYPHRFNSVIGAARAAIASGDSVAARSYYRELLTLAARSGRREELAEARRFTRSRIGSTR